MNKKFVPISIIVVIIILAIGFFLFNSGEKSSEGVSIKQTAYSEDVSNLVLSINDLPEGYKIVERSPRTTSDVSEDGLNHGWIEGYYIRYLKGSEENIFDISRVELFISRYPLENITWTIDGTPLEVEGYISGALPDPKLGDKSVATKLTEDELGFSEYNMAFYKKDIYVNLINGGATTDYEVLKDLAKKIERKI